MPYPYFPDATFLRTGSSNGHLTLAIDIPTRVTPLDVSSWLLSRGWVVGPSHPDTGEVLYCREAGDPHHWTWTEAIAYECYRFLSIGGE